MYLIQIQFFHKVDQANLLGIKKAMFNTTVFIFSTISQACIKMFGIYGMQYLHIYSLF